MTIDRHSRAERKGIAMQTCRSFDIASLDIKSPLDNRVIKHITWYWLWPRSSSPSTSAFNIWISWKEFYKHARTAIYGEKKEEQKTRNKSEKIII